MGFPYEQVTLNSLAFVVAERTNDCCDFPADLVRDIENNQINLQVSSYLMANLEREFNRHRLTSVAQDICNHPA